MYLRLASIKDKNEFAAIHERKSTAHVALKFNIQASKVQIGRNIGCRWGEKREERPASSHSYLNFHRAIPY